jgi:hypothetical protein
LEEAWELVEEEMMIVGAVCQEEDCSWQDACKPWMEQDEEAVTGVYQVGTCQGAAGVATETKEGAAGQPSVSQCKKAGVAEANGQASEPDDLLLEGEEGEYFLELLMRKASPERPEAGCSVEDKEGSRAKAASAKNKKTKRDKKKEKKALKKGEAAKEEGKKRGGDDATGLGSNPEKRTAPDLLHNLEAKGRGLIADDREEEEPVTRSRTTPRGECSGKKTPDSS